MPSELSGQDIVEVNGALKAGDQFELRAKDKVENKALRDPNVKEGERSQVTSFRTSITTGYQLMNLFHELTALFRPILNS